MGHIRIVARCVRVGHRPGVGEAFDKRRTVFDFGRPRGAGARGPSVLAPGVLRSSMWRPTVERCAARPPPYLRPVTSGRPPTTSSPQRWTTSYLSSVVIWSRSSWAATSRSLGPDGRCHLRQGPFVHTSGTETGWCQCLFVLPIGAPGRCALRPARPRGEPPVRPDGEEPASRSLVSTRPPSRGHRQPLTLISSRSPRSRLTRTSISCRRSRSPPRGSLTPGSIGAARKYGGRATRLQATSLAKSSHKRLVVTGSAVGSLAGSGPAWGLPRLPVRAYPREPASGRRR